MSCARCARASDVLNRIARTPVVATARMRIVALATCTLLTCGGCALVDSDQPASTPKQSEQVEMTPPLTTISGPIASEHVERFHQALELDDLDEACALIAPSFAGSLSASGCAEALTHDYLPGERFRARAAEQGVDGAFVIGQAGVQTLALHLHRAGESWLIDGIREAHVPSGVAGEADASAGPAVAAQRFLSALAGGDGRRACEHVDTQSRLMSFSGDPALCTALFLDSASVEVADSAAAARLRRVRALIVDLHTEKSGRQLRPRALLEALRDRTAIKLRLGARSNAAISGYANVVVYDRASTPRKTTLWTRSTSGALLRLVSESTETTVTRIGEPIGLPQARILLAEQAPEATVSFSPEDGGSFGIELVYAVRQSQHGPQIVWIATALSQEGW